MNRSPVVSGFFYPAKKDELLQHVRLCFLDREIGPGSLPEPRPSPLESPVGLISPHAGYVYSGPVAAWGYLEVAKFGRPETVIVIGPNHTGLGKRVGVWRSGKWITPLGEVEVDEETADLILENSEYAEEDTLSHIREHSIEVQLPFLQFVFQNFSIVPICLMDQGPKVSADLAKALKVVMERKKSVLIVASTDLNHYEDQNTTLRKDSLVIDAIEKGDANLLYAYLAQEDISVCGYGGIAVLLNLGFKERKVLKHATSGDVSGDYLEVVGYLSAIMYS